MVVVRRGGTVGREMLLVSWICWEGFEIEGLSLYWAGVFSWGSFRSQAEN